MEAPLDSAGSTTRSGLAGPYKIPSLTRLSGPLGTEKTELLIPMGALAAEQATHEASDTSRKVVDGGKKKEEEVCEWALASPQVL